MLFVPIRLGPHCHRISVGSFLVSKSKYTHSFWFFQLDIVNNEKFLNIFSRNLFLQPLWQVMTHGVSVTFWIDPLNNGLSNVYCYVNASLEITMLFCSRLISLDVGSTFPPSLNHALREASTGWPAINHRYSWRASRILLLSSVNGISISGSTTLHTCIVNYPLCLLFPSYVSHLSYIFVKERTSSDFYRILTLLLSRF